MARKRRIIIIGGLVAIVLVGLVMGIRLSRSNQAIVETGQVERRAVLKAKVSASGEIRAKMFVDVQPEVAGVITEIYVREGDQIKAGDKLLRINSVQTEAEKNMADSQVETALAEVKSQQIQIETANVNYQRNEFMLQSARYEQEQTQINFGRIRKSFERKQQLFELNLISREEFDLVQAELRAAEAQLDATRARVAQAEAQVRAARSVIDQMKALYAASLSRVNQAEARLMQARDQFVKTIIYAPIDGVITKLNVEKGERAVPGSMFNPQATLMVIADMSTVEVELKVDETDIVAVALGNEAKVTVDALSEQPIYRRVTEIGNSPMNQVSSQMSTSSQEGKDFRVIIQLDQPLRELRPGLSSTAEITTAIKRNVLVAPLQAVTVREVEVDENENYIRPVHEGKVKMVSANATATKLRKKELQGVFVVNQDQRVSFRPVKTGLMGDMDIEVIEGLREGEEVISGSYKTLRTITDGDLVKVDNSAGSKPEKE